MKKLIVLSLLALATSLSGCAGIEKHSCQADQTSADGADPSKWKHIENSWKAYLDPNNLPLHE